MFNLVSTKQFKKDIKLLKKQGKDLSKLWNVLDLLVYASSLPAKYKNHSLSGKFAGYKELHIEPDWLLIYLIENDNIYLTTTGSHANLFKR